MIRAVRILLCFFVLTLPACEKAAAEADRFLDIQEFTTRGGITVWLVEDHTLPLISMKFSFEGAGAAQDPVEKQGLAQLASNTLDEGAGDLESQEFQKILSDKSISLSFSSGRDDFGGSLKTMADRKDLAFDLLRLALNEPRFDPEPVERMRQANLARIRSSLSDPEWMAARLLNDVAFEGHPYAKNSGGTLSTLLKITPGDLRHFVKTRLARENLKIAVTGDITAKELGPLIDGVFGGLPEKPNLPDIADTQIMNAGEIVLFEKDIPQTIIEIMQPGIGRDHPDYHAFQVMNYILGGGGFGSRLTEEIREKRGLTYGIYSSSFRLDHAKGLAVSTSTVNDKAAEVLDLIQQELERMRAEPVADTELADAKAYLVGSMPLSLSSTDAIAGLVLGLQLDDLPIDYLDTLNEKIESVAKEDIQRVAAEILQPGNLTITLVGKPENVTPTRTVETLPNVE